jgi:hypothetical protein
MSRIEAPFSSRPLDANIRCAPTMKDRDLHCVPTPLNGISAALQQAAGNAIAVQFKNKGQRLLRDSAGSDDQQWTVNLLQYSCRYTAIKGSRQSAKTVTGHYNDIHVHFFGSG